MYEIENDLRGEIAAKQKTIDALHAQILASKQSVQRVEQIKEFIINLCVEMKDRSAETGPPNYEAEREVLRSTDIMVLSMLEIL